MYIWLNSQELTKKNNQKLYKNSKKNIKIIKKPQNITNFKISIYHNI